MFYFYLHKLTDTCSSCCEETNHEVPLFVIFLLKFLFQEEVIGIADDILQIGTLLNLYRFQSEFGLPHKIEVLVDGLNT